MLADETLVDPGHASAKNSWATEMAYAEYVGEITENCLSQIRSHITLYVGLACAVSPTNTNFWLTVLLTRLEALYEDLPV